MRDSRGLHARLARSGRASLRNDGIEDFRGLGSEPFFEAMAHVVGKEFNEQEVGFALFYDSAFSQIASVGPQPAAGHDVMDMGMIGELPGPGVKDAKEPSSPPEMARDACNLLKSRTSRVPRRERSAAGGGWVFQNSRSPASIVGGNGTSGHCRPLPRECECAVRVNVAYAKARFAHAKSAGIG